MSYILDALRRAESERTRGQVPGLDAQALALTGDDERPARSGRAARLAGGGAALVLVAVAAWWGLSREEAAVPPALSTATSVPASPVAVAPMPATTAPVPAAWPAPPSVAPVAPVAPVATTPAPPPVATLPPPAPVPPAVVARPAPPTASSGRAPADGLPAVPAAAPVDPATPRPAASAPSRPAEPRPLRLADLTPQQRSELPPMAVGGAIYSDNAASRFILVNGQVVREGDAAAPGVMLERIGPRAAVLRWRELRIEVPY